MGDRIATFTQTSKLIQGNIRLQSNYSEKSLQVSSGFKSDTYSGIATDTSRLLNLETDYKRITQQSENAQISLDRVELMYGAMTSMVEQTQKFSADMMSVVSGFGLSGADLINNAQTYLNQLANALNTEISGRTLFSGSATETKPVDLTAAGFGGQTYTAPGPSVANTNYYQGNNFIQSVEAIEGFPINYGVTADNSAFEKAIRAYDLIITNPNDPDTQTEALRLIQESADEMAVLQASLSQRAQTLDQQLLDNLEQLNLLDNQIVNIREVDVAEATVALKQLETQLEASYTVTSTLLNLKLSDYIR